MLLAAAALPWVARAAPGAEAPDPFSRPAIAAVMRRADQWQLAHLRPAIGPRDWIRATWYTGVMAAYLATGDRAYLDQATGWAEAQGWRPGTERAGANVLTCSQTYLELYFLHPDRSRIQPTIDWLNSGRPNTPTGATVWYLDGQRYADSLYVGAPPLAMLAKATGDRRYLAWMNAFFWDVTRELFDGQEGLFYRDRTYIGQRTPNGKKVFWSRGNGWVFASLPRILDNLAADDPERTRYETLFRTMAAALVRRQPDSGLWPPNLDDPKDLPMPESSGTGFFCYGLAWGVRRGLLESGRYLPAARRSWAGLVAVVTPEGMVQWGQSVDSHPGAVQPGDTDEYVTGTFLLAGSGMFLLAQ
jgi:rhamnogalacturonyl hydrolase YesR